MGDGIVVRPVRTILRFESLLILGALVAAYWQLHASWIVFVVLLLAPDVAMLGYLRDTKVGAWSYNAFHTYACPVALAFLSVPFRALLPLAVIWAAHIAMDRALGYGLKYAESFQHTHLGFIGKSAGSD